MMQQARSQSGPVPFDLEVKKDLTDQEVATVVSQLRTGVTQVFFDSVEEFRKAADFINKFFHINLFVDRFMGGPRRDIVLLLPGWEIKVFMRWKDFLGKFVMHCHNVVHEDHAMMIRWDITPRPADSVPTRDEKRPHVEPHPGQATSQVEDGRKPLVTLPK